MPLILEVKYGNSWFPMMAPPAAVVEEIKKAFDISEDEELSGWMAHREEHPELDKWLYTHAYTQQVISVSHSPDVMEEEQTTVQKTT